MHSAAASADTVVTALPCPHVYANVVMNGTMLYGMTMVLLERFEETAVLSKPSRNIRRRCYDAVPTAYMMIMAHP